MTKIELNFFGFAKELTVSDDTEKIEFDKMAEVGKLIFHTMWELANRPDRIIVDGKIK